MDNTAILKEFEDAEAILNGHFILSSGLHSDTYLQCARVLMDPERADRLCHILAKKVWDILGDNAIDLVVAPAMGGVIVGYEMARQLGVNGIFCERVEGQFTLRRGFSIPKGANILVVEDVITTGKSSIETIECLKNYEGNIVGEACLIDRSNGASADLGIPVISLAEVKVQTFESTNVPAELTNIEAIKPGSRWIKQIVKTLE